MTRRHDDQIHRGFDAGNYANAYETTCLETALAKLSMNRSERYRAAFTLGFLGDRERHELGSYEEAYDAAFALVGERARAIGIATCDLRDVSGEDYHTSTSYGVMPDRDLFRRAFDARCPEGTFSFGNDPYIGTDTLTEPQLWRELQAQYATWEAGEHKPGCLGDGECRGDGCPCEEAGQWCSAVLGILGFEWI